MNPFPFPAPALDESVLQAIRMALGSVDHASVRVIDRLLREQPPRGENPAGGLSLQEALGIFAALVKIEWDRRRAEFAGIPIHSLVASWKEAIVPILDR